MAISRPFLITLIALGYIATAAVELFVAIAGFAPNFLLGFIADASAPPLNLAALAAWQFLLGIALYKGNRLAWWLTVIGAYIPIITHVIGGIRGERWAWATILWNMLVISYMQSRDVQAFFGREAY